MTSFPRGRFLPFLVMMIGVLTTQPAINSRAVNDTMAGYP